jgi:hypothetical protein
MIDGYHAGLGVLRFILLVCESIATYRISANKSGFVASLVQALGRQSVVAACSTMNRSQ